MGNTIGLFDDFEPADEAVGVLEADDGHDDIFPPAGLELEPPDAGRKERLVEQLAEMEGDDGPPRQRREMTSVHARYQGFALWQWLAGVARVGMVTWGGPMIARSRPAFRRPARLRNNAALDAYIIDQWNAGRSSSEIAERLSRHDNPDWRTNFTGGAWNRWAIKTRLQTLRRQQPKPRNELLDFIMSRLDTGLSPSAVAAELAQHEREEWRTWNGRPWTSTAVGQITYRRRKQRARA